MLEQARGVFVSEGLRACGRKAVGRWPVGLHAVGRGDARRGFVTGVRRCGLLWLCPVCSARIRRARTDTLRAVLGAHRAEGGGIGFLTLTVRHHQGDELGELLDKLAAAFRWANSGATMARARASVGGAEMVRALEVTYGERNGWHPHIHAVVLTGRPMDGAEAAAHAALWRDRWERACAKFGLPAPSRRYGIAFSVAEGPAIEDALAGYLTKLAESGLASEMTTGPIKGGGIWDIVERAETTTGRARARWRAVAQEFEAAIKGRRALVFPRGLLARYGLADDDGEGAHEFSADEADTVETVGLLRADDWRHLAHKGAIPRLLGAAVFGAAAVRLVIADYPRDDGSLAPLIDPAGWLRATGPP